MSKFTPFQGEGIGRIPPVVTVTGDKLLPDEAQKILNASLGEVRQFYMAANAAHAAGNNQFSSRIKEGTNFDLRYQNNAGQERVEVHVKPTRKKPAGDKTPWDWAVIDFEIPLFSRDYLNGSHVYAPSELYVEMVRPTPRTDGPESSPDAVWGAAGTDPTSMLFSREDPPLLQWARAETRPQASGDIADTTHTEKQSLLIDLRRFRTMKGELKFEVWGDLLPMGVDYERVPVGQVGYYRRVFPATPGPLLIDGPFGSEGNPATRTQRSGPYDYSGGIPPSPYTDYTDFSQVPPGYPTPYPQRGGGDETAPAVAEGALTPFWSDLAGPTTRVYIPQGMSWFTAIPGIMGYWDFHENSGVEEYTPVYSFVSNPVTVSPVSTVTVKWAMFRGTPDWQWVNVVHDPEDELYSALWVIASQHPARFRTGKIAENVAIRNNQPGNTYALLGHLLVSPEMGYTTFKAVA